MIKWGFTYKVKCWCHTSVGGDKMGIYIQGIVPIPHKPTLLVEDKTTKHSDNWTKGANQQLYNRKDKVKVKYERKSIQNQHKNQKLLLFFILHSQWEQTKWGNTIITGHKKVCWTTNAFLIFVCPINNSWFYTNNPRKYIWLNSLPVLNFNTLYVNDAVLITHKIETSCL